MRLLWAMSASGSIVIIIYWLGKKFFAKYSDTKWRYFLLKLAILFYLLPFQFKKGLLRNFCPFLWSKPDKNNRIYLDPNNIIEIYNNGEIMFHLPKFYIISFWIWLIIVFFLFLIGIRIYYMQKKNILKNSIPLYSAEINRLVKQQQRTLKIQRKIIIRKGTNFLSPITIGLWNPIIVLPDRQFEIKELEMIIKHECVHIKHKDAWIKLFAMLVVIFHWFNPLVYYLLTEINILAENVCDEHIVLLMKKKERQYYGELILRMATIPKNTENIFAFSFSNNHKRVKERIELIMNVHTQKKIFQIFSFVIIVITCVISSMTIFAYEAPIIVSGGLKSDEMDTKEECEIFISKNPLDKVIFPTDTQPELLPEYFQDKAGNFYKINGTTRNSGCIHNLESVTYYKHYKKGAGCVYKIYTAKICNKCNFVKNKVLEQNTTFKKCPH